MTKMLFSVVTPAKNQLSYLKHCVAAMAATSAEHIVSDGASTDGSVAFLESQTELREQRFGFLSAPDKGMYQALNRGFTHAQGDIFAYLNCDDLLLPWTLELVEEAFERQPEIDLIVGDALEWNEDNGRAALVIHPPAPLLGRYLREGGFLAQPAVFFRRRLFEALGGFDDRLRLLGGSLLLLAAIGVSLVPILLTDAILTAAEKQRINVWCSERMNRLAVSPSGAVIVANADNRRVEIVHQVP